MKYIPLRSFDDISYCLYKIATEPRILVVKSILTPSPLPYRPASLAHYDITSNTIVVPEVVWEAYQKKDPLARAFIAHETSHSKLKTTRPSWLEELRAISAESKLLPWYKRPINMLLGLPSVILMPRQSYTLSAEDYRKILSSPEFRNEIFYRYFNRPELFAPISTGPMTPEKFEMMLRALKNRMKPSRIRRHAGMLYRAIESQFPGIHKEVKEIAMKRNLLEALTHFFNTAIPKERTFTKIMQKLIQKKFGLFY